MLASAGGGESEREKKKERRLGGTIHPHACSGFRRGLCGGSRILEAGPHVLGHLHPWVVSMRALAVPRGSGSPFV
jgi:hypothetical protein